MPTHMPHPKLVKATIYVLQAIEIPGGAGIQERRAVGGCECVLARAKMLGNDFTVWFYILLMYVNYEDWLDANLCKVKYSVIECIIDLATELFPSLDLSLTSIRKGQVITSTPSLW